MAQPNLDRIVGIDLGHHRCTSVYLDEFGTTRDVIGEAVKWPPSADVIESFELYGENSSAVDQVALVFDSLLSDACSHLACDLDSLSVAISTPLGPAERQGIKRAASQAGLRRFELIEQPIAAALSYILGQEGMFLAELVASQTLLAIDVQRSRAEVALVKYDRKNIKLTFRAFDDGLGLDRWNEALRTSVVNQFQSEFAVDPMEDEFDRQAIELETEQTRRSLRVRPKTSLTIQAGGHRKSFVVTREQFIHLTSHLIDQLRRFIQGLMTTHRIGFASIDAVLLTGEASQILSLQEMLREIGRRVLITSFGPDESFARGAAYYASFREQWLVFTPGPETEPFDLHVPQAPLEFSFDAARDDRQTFPITNALQPTATETQLDGENYYHKFLGLPIEVTQPDHYQLLGVERFTHDLAVLKRAAIARNTQLRGWDNSKFYREADKVLEEVIAASFVLEDAVKRAAYDRNLVDPVIPIAEPPVSRIESTAVVPAPAQTEARTPNRKRQPKRSNRITVFPPAEMEVVERSRGDRGLWGLDIGTTGLKAVRIQPAGPDSNDMILSDADYLPHRQSMESPGASPVDLLAETLTAFTDRHDLRFDRVAIGCRTDQALIRSFLLPPVEPKNVASIIAYEAKQQIPFPLEDVVLDHQILPGSDEVEGLLLNATALLVAAKTDLIHSIAKPVLASGLPVELIQISSLAGINCLLNEDKADTELEYAGIACLGASNCWIAFTNGRNQWCRTIPINGNTFTRAISKDAKMTWDKSEQVKLDFNDLSDPLVGPLLKPVVNDFVTELQRSIAYFSSLHRPATIRSIRAIGDGWRLAGLLDFCREHLGNEFEFSTWDKLPTLTADDPDDDDSIRKARWFQERESAFAIAYGLALQLARPQSCMITTSLFPKELRPTWFQRAMRAFANL